MTSDLVRQLVDAGIHFGHRASRWNPKMGPFIYGKRNTIHIIDIRETVKGLLRAKRFIAQVVARGDDVLFVGTKRQARHHVRQQATRVGMPYVAERWLGGTLTNFRTIRSRVGRLEELEKAEADGTMQQFSKKMIATRTRELRKIRRNLEGIRNMTRLPGALIVIDVQREHNAVREAKKFNVPTVCLIDTDSDPDFADLPIPGNDDAMRAIETVLVQLADAVEEGLKARKQPQPEAQAAQPSAAEAPRSVPPRRLTRPRDRRSETPAAALRPDRTVADESGTSADPEAATEHTPTNDEADARLTHVTAADRSASSRR